MEVRSLLLPLNFKFGTN